MSIYSDVQIFADEIFADGCRSAKTANIKPRENLSAYGMYFIVSSHLSLLMACLHSCSSRLAVLRSVPTFFKSALSVLSMQILGLPCLALGMLFTVRSSAF